MKSIVKKSKEFAAAAVLATLPFAAIAGDEAPAMDKMANSEKAASCLLDKFKSDITKEFNQLNTQAAPQNDKQKNIMQAAAKAMAKMTPNTMDCVSEVTGVPKDQMPPVPDMDDYFSNRAKFEKQAIKFEEFVSEYFNVEAYQKALDKGMKDDIVPFLNELLQGNDKKAAPVPAPAPAPKS